MRIGRYRRVASRQLGLLGIASLVLALIAVAIGIPGGVRAQDTSTKPDATLRILHGSPGSPAVDVLIDGQPFVKNLAFGKVTDYAPLKEGKYNVQIVPTGQPAANAVVTKDVSVDSGKAYILAIKNPLKDIDADVYEVNLDAVSAGKARVRAIQLSDDIGKVDIAVTGGDTLFSGLDNGDKSDYKDVDPGTYSFDIRGDNDRVLLTATDVDIAVGNSYDMFVIGEQADKTLALVPLVTSVSQPCASALGLQGDATDACVRVVHASPGSPALDIYVNGSVAVQGLAFGSATDYVAVPSGDKVKLQAVASGADLENAVIDKEFGLDAGQAYEFVATGDLNDIQLTQSEVDLTPLPEGQARVRVIHAATDVDGIDVAIQGQDKNLFEGIDFRDASDYAVVQAGKLTIQIKKGGADDVLLQADTNLAAGSTYDLVVTGRQADQSLTLIALESKSAVRQGGVATPAAGGTPVMAGTVVSQSTTTSLTPATGATETLTQEPVLTPTATS